VEPFRGDQQADRGLAQPGGQADERVGHGGALRELELVLTPLNGAGFDQRVVDVL